MGDVAVQRHAQPEDQPALDLRGDRIGVHPLAAIDRDGGAPQPDFAARRHLHLQHMRQERGKRILHRNAAPHARRQLFTPAGFFRRQVQHRQRARILLQQRTPVLNRILSRRGRAFIHKPFHHKHVVRGPHAAPPGGCHPRRLMAHILHLHRRQIVGRLCRPLHRIGIQLPLHPRRQPARHHR